MGIERLYRMTLSEYYKMPRGEQKNMVVGDRFRPIDARESGVKIGAVVGFYEVISVKSSQYTKGYEVMFMHDKITENEPNDSKKLIV
jgi:hypothetical protein